GEDDLWLVARRTTSAVDDDPEVGELHVGRSAGADRGAVQNDLAAEDLAIEARGGFDVLRHHAMGRKDSGCRDREIRPLHHHPLCWPSRRGSVVTWRERVRTS